MDASFDIQQMFESPGPASHVRHAAAVAARHAERIEASCGLHHHPVRRPPDAAAFSWCSQAQMRRVMGRTILEMDGKEHGWHRALVQQSFAPKALDGLEPLL